MNMRKIKMPTWTTSWSDEMSVGIPEIDDDHKRFIMLLNELNKSIVNHVAPEEITAKAQFIVDDAERHFSREEQLFKEMNYPDTNDHANIHAHVLKLLKASLNNFAPYGADSGWVHVGSKIRDLLLGHILNEDMKYADHYRDSIKVIVNKKL